MDGLINWMRGIFSQCVCISSRHIVYFKYLTILFLNYTSIKLEKKNPKNFLEPFPVMVTVGEREDGNTSCVKLLLGGPWN